MKKILLVVVAIIAFGSAKAQGTEVGVRLGDFNSNHFAVDAVFSVGQFSRVHADASFGSGLGVDALYDFLYKPIPDVEGLDWYVGAGPSLYLSNDYFGFGVSGEAGVEYHFHDIPLSVGLDYRPTFWIVEDTHVNWGDFGVNVRFCF